jgi:hypothetical protein
VVLAANEPAHLEGQWIKERAAVAEFDAENPEITISEFRELEKST